MEAILKGTAFCLSGLLRVNCEAKLRVTCYLIGGIQNLLRQKPCKGAKTDSRAKFGKETVAGAYRRPKWVPHYGTQADSGHTQDTQGSAQALLRLAQALLGLAQALLRLCSGLLRLARACSPSAQVYSPSAQVKAAVAHVRRLKRNQQKGKLILSLWVFCIYMSSN
jgi:hypothetical protein